MSLAKDPTAFEKTFADGRGKPLPHASGTSCDWTGIGLGLAHAREAQGLCLILASVRAFSISPLGRLHTPGCKATEFLRYRTTLWHPQTASRTVKIRAMPAEDRLPDADVEAILQRCAGSRMFAAKAKAASKPGGCQCTVSGRCWRIWPR